MYDQQIAYLSSNQRQTHMVHFLCCFAVKKWSNIKVSASLSSAIFWRDKWHVSWFNNFISWLSSETKPRPKSWPTLSIVWCRLYSITDRIIHWKWQRRCYRLATATETTQTAYTVNTCAHAVLCGRPNRPHYRSCPSVYPVRVPNSKNKTKKTSR